MNSRFFGFVFPQICHLRNETFCVFHKYMIESSSQNFNTYKIKNSDSFKEPEFVYIRLVVLYSISLLTYTHRLR